MEERLNAIVGARIGEFRRKMAEARAIAAAFPKKIVTSVEMVRNDMGPRIDKFRVRMDKLADAYRDMNVIAAEAMWGGLVTTLPMLVAMIPGLTAVLATAGVQIGVMSGGLLGLASSATAALAGFGLLAPFLITTGQNLYLMEQNIARGSAEWNKLSDNTKNAINALDQFQGVYGKIEQRLQSPIYAGFTLWLQGATKALQLAEPTLHALADAFVNLGNSFKKAMNSADVKGIFEYFKEAAPRAMENWGRIAGTAILGVLNLMKAFDPLAQTMEKGLLKMTTRFNEWAKGLEKSDKFKKFIEYVQTNGPVLLDVIGNIALGLINLFVAFAPLSADMMRGFQDMTQRFEEWSAKLSENAGFKAFVGYIRDNGPQMLELIGNLTTFLIELGKGFAKVGEWLMPIVNGFLSWANALMQANPNIASSVAVMGTLFGVFKAFAPVIIAAVSLFGGFFRAVGAGFASMARIAVPYITMLLRQFDQLVIRIVLGALKMIGQFGMLAGKIAMFMGRIVLSFLRFLGPWGLIISAVIALAIVVVKNWDKIKQWTIQTFAKVYSWIQQKWQQIKAVTVAVATALWNYVKTKWTQLQTWTVTTFAKIYTTIRQKFEQAKNIVRTVAQAIWSNVKEKFLAVYNSVKSYMQQTKADIQAKWQQIKTDIRNKATEIYNNIKEKFQQIKESVKNKVQEAKDAAQRKFEEMKEAISEKIEAAKEVVQSGLESIKGFFDDFSLFDQGKKIIQSVIDGIKAMTKPVEEAIGGVVSVISRFLPNSPAKEGPLDNIHRLDFGGPITTSINRMQPDINRAMTRATAGLRATVGMEGITAPSVNPVTNVNNYAPEIPTDYERDEAQYGFYVDGKELAKLQAPHSEKISRQKESLNVALKKLSAQ